MSSLAYDAAGIAAVEAVTALLPGGYLAIYTGTQPDLDGDLTGTQLVAVPFASPAFAAAAASGGTVTAAVEGSPSAVIAATGTAGYAALLESDGATVAGTMSVGTSDADLILSSLSLVEDATFTLSDFSVTQSQTGS